MSRHPFLGFQRKGVKCMERFAIVGFGCAGYHALEQIRKSGCNAEIDIYSDTDIPPYNPMLTTYYAGGKLSYEGLFPFGTLEEIKRKYQVHIFTETKVKRVEAQNHIVITEDGTEHSYDKILISTGARAFVPASFADLEGALCMRTVEDAGKLREVLEKKRYKEAVVVGASMVGIKVAEILYRQGIHVTLADMAPHIFALAAYPTISEMIEERIRKIGITLEFGQAITQAEEHRDANGKVTGYTVSLGDGRKLETELLVLNIGTRAVVDILDSREIQTDRGILVDEQMRTSVPGIYAAGDCCQGNDLQSGKKMIIGLWANAGVQGDVAGRNMAGLSERTEGNILHNITHFLDMDFIGLGDNRVTGEVYEYTDKEKRFYLRAVIKDGKPAGFNILDHYGVSGILKAHLMKVLRGEPGRFTPEQRGQLIRMGIEKKFIDYLEEQYE